MDGRMTLGTIWLGGCSGCHMSLLDLDERLFDLAAKADIAFSPLTDRRTPPERLDILLVEGAVAQVLELAWLKELRARTRMLVAFGDCAVIGNVTAMRNGLDLARMLRDSYGSAGDAMGSDPGMHLPVLLDEVLPLHRVVDVDVFLPGCPPAADLIWYTLTELFEGRTPVLDGEKLRYG